MGIFFSADEIFRIGMDVELNGRAFYEAAVEQSESEEAKAMLKHLGDEEVAHYETFSKMREQLPPQAKTETVFDPDGQLSAYLKALADSRVFTNETQAAEVARGCKTAADVLRVALGFEKDSVLMFQAMKEMTRADLGKEKIDGLIRSEKDHISTLSKALEQIQK